MLETGGGQNVWKSSYLRGSKCLKLDNDKILKKRVLKALFFKNLR
jgi:hypothetical protein